MAVDDEMIEAIARENHSRWQDGNPVHPENVDWDSLPAATRQQNFRQTRHVLAFLESMGIVGERVDNALNGSLVEELTIDELDLFGRSEHDRWAQAKVEQGFVWGPTLDRDSTPKTHPDLVDYDELSPETQKKDYAPLVDALEVMRTAGYVLVRTPE